MQASKAPSLTDPSPTDLVSLLSGSSSVSLSAFADETAIGGSRMHPATPFVAARQFDLIAPGLTASAKKWRRLVLALTGLGLLLLGLALGALVALAQVDWRLPGSALPGWSIDRVVEKGVMVKMGANTDLVPVGGRLPNGAVVVSVFPDRGVVVLDSATVLLSPKGSSK